MLFEISPADPLTYAAVAGILLLVSVVSLWLPARRALHIEPVVALRNE